jgi:hypothetical protein
MSRDQDTSRAATGMPTPVLPAGHAGDQTMTPADVLTDAEETPLRARVPPTATLVARPAPYASVDPVPIGDPDEAEGYNDDDDDDEDEEDDEEPLQCAWRSAAGPAAMTTARRFFIVLESQIPVPTQ